MHTKRSIEMFIMSYVVCNTFSTYLMNIIFTMSVLISLPAKNLKKLKNWYDDNNNNWERTENKHMSENSYSWLINVKFTPKVVEVEKSIWECFLLNATRDDIITPVKVQEEVKSKVQKTKVHTTINSGTVLCQSTLYIAEWICWWHNPIQWAL